VSVKHVGIVLRADNDGEAGILALLALAFLRMSEERVSIPPRLCKILSCVQTEPLFFWAGKRWFQPRKALSRLRRTVFRLMSRNAENAADFFQLPCDRTVEIGFPVEL
jgi:K+ transporter